MLNPKVGIAILVTAASTLAAESPQKQAWEIVTQAISGRGPDEVSALAMLGAIDDQASRSLIEATLKGRDIVKIGSVAAGLTPAECMLYLPELGRAAQDPEADPKLRILDAIARADSSDAARILANVADSAGQPAAGVAFALLERMKTNAEPYLILAATNGKSASSRGTAAWTLIRMRSTGARPAFRSALHDPDERVRNAAAIGLARLGSDEGKPQLEAAASNPGSEDQLQALVALAALGQVAAFDRLRALVTSPDEKIRGQAVWAMAWSGSKKVKEFAYRMGLDRQPAFRGMLAEKLLDPNDGRDTAVLQGMIAHGDEMSQIIAAQRLLGTTLNDRAEAVVANALGSGSDAVRALAVKVASADPALRIELANRVSSQDPEVQIAALSAIRDLQRKDRFSEVMPYLASEARAVSAAAALTLAALDPVAAKRVFEEGLTSKSGYVRIHSAAMLLAIATHAQP